MISRSWRRQEPLDQEELARLLPAPGNPVLFGDRQRLLEDFLMNTITEEDARPADPAEPARPARSRRLAVRIAVPAALAAALLGTAFAFHQDATPHGKSSVTATGHTTGEPPQHISNVAYTLDRAPQGTVTVTIHNSGATQSDLARLQRDLDRMGVKAHIYRSDPSCAHEQGQPAWLGDAAIKAIRFRPHNRDTIATIHPGEMPAGTWLEIIFPSLPVPADRRGTFGFTLETGKPPACRNVE